jgi:hypothetical protein
MLRTTEAHSAARDRWVGFLFGLLAGVVVLIMTWGVDALALDVADGILPWAKAEMGAIGVILPFGGLAWVSTRMQRPVMSMILWLLGGLAFGWFATQVSFRLLPLALIRWTPEVARFINYPYGDGPAARAILSSIFSGFFFSFAGLILVGLVETWSRATYPAGRYLPLLAWTLLFIVSGAVVDGLVNRPLRTPAVVLSRLITYRQSQSAATDPLRYRQMHAGALNAIEELLPLRHRIVVAGYDETISTVRLAVSFEGHWAECTVVEDQPVFCRPAQ